MVHVIIGECMHATSSMHGIIIGGEPEYPRA